MVNYKVIQMYGKTFYWASKFMDKKLIEPIYAIYEMCREIDDMVDENNNLDAKKEIEKLKKNLSITTLKKRFNCLKKIGKKKFPRNEYLKEFILGQESDIEFKQPKSINELLKYCYRVAGVVGLMVCDAVEIKDKNMKYFAIDLGIGMQLINIIRDIKEDAENKRVYIPVNLIGQVDPDDVLNNQQVIEKIDNEKRKILKIAENYFNSANYAIRFLPKNISICFGLASKLYQAIGIKILKKEKSYIEGRVYLNNFEKIFITLSYYLNSKKKSNNHPVHNNMLHLPIKNSPSVDG